MSTVVSPDQQWSLSSDAFAPNGDIRDGRVTDQDARYPRDPRFARPSSADPRAAQDSPATTAPFQPFPMPIHRAEPAPVAADDPRQSVGAARPGSRLQVVDQGRFWVGAVLTAGVAALAGVTGLVVAQDLLRVPVPLTSIGLTGAHVSTYGLMAALVALLAALAYDGMLTFAPRPAVYYGWLTGLLVALAVFLPFAAPVALASQLALALVNLVVGVAIMVLVPVAAAGARGR